MNIEKAIAAALEPLVDVIAKIDERLREVEAPTNIEVPIDDVAAALKADDEFRDLVKGQPGADGVTPEIDTNEITEKLLGVIQQLKGDPGADGLDGLNGADGADGIGYDAKQWSPGVYREGAIVQHDFGRLAKAVRDTADMPGDSQDWERVGTSGFRVLGVKSEAREYQEGDFFIDDGTTFLMTGGKPRMFARKGRDGKPGKDGADGVHGKNGKDGKDGRDGKDASALIGEIKIWPGVDAPAGFVLADGSAVPDGEEYDELRALHGDTVPDFSSEFLVSEVAGKAYIATFIIRAFVA